MGTKWYHFILPSLASPPCDAPSEYYFLSSSMQAAGNKWRKSRIILFILTTKVLRISWFEASVCALLRTQA